MSGAGTGDVNCIDKVAYAPPAPRRTDSVLDQLCCFLVSSSSPRAGHTVTWPGAPACPPCWHDARSQQIAAPATFRTPRGRRRALVQDKFLRDENGSSSIRVAKGHSSQLRFQMWMPLKTTVLETTVHEGARGEPDMLPEACTRRAGHTTDAPRAPVCPGSTRWAAQAPRQRTGTVMGRPEQHRPKNVLGRPPSFGLSALALG